jgi:hypothetical protein
MEYYAAAIFADRPLYIFDQKSATPIKFVCGAECDQGPPMYVARFSLGYYSSMEKYVCDKVPSPMQYSEVTSTESFTPSSSAQKIPNAAYPPMQLGTPAVGAVIFQRDDDSVAKKKAATTIRQNSKQEYIDRVKENARQERLESVKNKGNNARATKAMNRRVIIPDDNSEQKQKQNGNCDEYKVLNDAIDGIKNQNVEDLYQN